jgi:hypothetical protein
VASCLGKSIDFYIDISIDCLRALTRTNSLILLVLLVASAKILAVKAGTFIDRPSLPCFQLTSALVEVDFLGTNKSRAFFFTSISYSFVIFFVYGRALLIT